MEQSRAGGPFPRSSTALLGGKACEGTKRRSGPRDSAKGARLEPITSANVSIDRALA